MPNRHSYAPVCDDSNSMPLAIYPGQAAILLLKHISNPSFLRPSARPTKGYPFLSSWQSHVAASSSTLPVTELCEYVVSIAVSRIGLPMLNSPSAKSGMCTVWALTSIVVVDHQLPGLATMPSADINLSFDNNFEEL